ncbi:phenylalanine--tRNA ligase subunit beta [Candidatus Peregrinibacteria bacterium]|nr:phenylalanine--tRNA ligase subunit beta [Candidatus Peregrinibacteria bacterium]
MRLSINWLRDFVKLAVTDPQEIARLVTACVAEVENVEILGGLLDRCVVGKILSVKKHPNADRLSLCDVLTDAGVKKIVCGGINLRDGMRVAFAHTGACVKWHGTEMMTLEKTNIRGEESEGMICTAAELDLIGRFTQKDDREVIDLGDGDEGVGEPLKEYLNLDDVVLHIDNHAITHRADLFSHLGFAREFVALGLATWKGGKKGRGGKRELPFPKTPLPFRCVVESKRFVPRCASCLLEVDAIGTTPLWMKKRLEATGWRSVSLPVDITNYVLMEMGMPLHCFDADDIRGDMNIRLSKNGEYVTTLDGQKRRLAEGCLVINDDEGIFDLLGIMGGLRSSTKERTKRMYLQAAILDSASIRRGILSTGHRTDGATVYEKGVPRCAALPVLLRAVELFLQLVPGARLVSRLEEWGDDGKATPITLSLDRAASLLGVEIPEKKVVKILEDLEFAVKRSRAKSESFVVTPPLHRLGDIRGQHDLIEEIGRITGYNEIPAQTPVASIAPPIRDMRAHRFRDGLKECGYSEIVPISLVGEALLKKCGLDPLAAVEIRNPIGEELKLLHTSALPGLLEHVQRNILQAGDRIKAFHVSNVFQKGHAEHMELGVLLADVRPRRESRAMLEEPFLMLKRDIGRILCSLGYSMELAVAGTAQPFVHPGRFAELSARPSSCAHSGEPFVRIGTIFELHPSVASAFDMPHRAAAVLLAVTTLLEIAPSAIIAEPVPQFPAVTYDFTETVRHTQAVGDILKRLRGSHEYLESVFVKDLYAASSSEKESYNITLTFTYRAKDRTLAEEEAKTAHAKVLALI